ncbi:MAG: aldehyde dehydrogenase family protein, partial [Bdellovibrionales bacterium]|nr:aldehyde dehydrogenase family protein [Bdellovibrionales bacterium]
MQKLANFINGEYCPPHSGKYLDNYDPATGEVYSLCPDSDEMDMVMAIKAAHSAFEKWSSTTVEERSHFLMRIAEGIEKRLEDLARAESRDQGKTYQQALEVEIPRAVKNFRFFATKVLHLQEMATDMDGKAFNYVVRDPVGVAGLISPWNLPLYLLTWKIAPAIAVGNTVVCKPSEWTPMTAYLLGEILNEAGLPPGVVNIVLGRGETAGATLVAHPGVPLISFTGGTETGEKILKGAAPQFKKVSLELGGKNANIICKDADLRKAIPATIRASFLNQGEICLCGSRIFVHQDIYDQFLEGFIEQTEKLVVGDPSDAKTFMGPLVSKEHYDNVLLALEKMKKDKGKIVAGGGAPEGLPAEMKNGYFIRPTIVKDLSECSEMQQEEIFGPVVSVMPFKYNHEAVKW